MSCTKKQFHSILYSKKSLSGFSIIMVSQPTNNSAANETNGASNYTHLIDNVGEILWPVQPWYASRSNRRNLAGSSKKRMKVLFPAHSLFRQFVSVDCDPVKKEYVFGGFVYDVFDAMMKIMDEPTI
ncbi:hypothetical protein HanRHA438_Chr10g0462621 [Helianthus annuus]|nr:hypothetical protein HanRHA438_Chr10g0462621 [Helianthus annuus]